MKPIPILLLLLASYVLGSVSFALLAGKLLRGIDIRDFGSGNVGATNAGRVLGKKIGILVFLLDVAKGFVPAWLFWRWIDTSPDDPVRAGLLFGFAAILGHSFPFYLRFKGGKAVATSAGVMLALAWLETLIALVVWVILVKLFRMISLASMAGALAFPLVFLLLRGENAYGRDLDLFLVGILLCVLILFRHRSNVRRILAGTESKIGEENSSSP